MAFTEKPTLGYSVSMGVYGVPATPSPIPRRRAPRVRLGHARSADDGQTPRSYKFDGYWLDIGRPEDYERANLEFPELRRTLFPEHEPVPSSLLEMFAA